MANLKDGLSLFLTDTDSNTRHTHCGMAYFAGTGPDGKTCGDCSYRGYYRDNSRGEAIRTTGCAMFRNLSGEDGPRVPSDAMACKYFQQKPRE